MKLKKDMGRREKIALETGKIPSSKAIKKRSGGIIRQYPAQVGYHGSGNEKDLNPEE